MMDGEGASVVHADDDDDDDDGDGDDDDGDGDGDGDGDDDEDDADGTRTRPTCWRLLCSSKSGWWYAHLNMRVGTARLFSFVLTPKINNSISGFS